MSWPPDIGMTSRDRTDHGKVSDGYHTFDELYEHRNLLMLALMARRPGLSWYAYTHEDGSMFPGMFICGSYLTDNKCITYHLPVDLLPMARNTMAIRHERAPKWDGHTSKDVVTMLRWWLTPSNLS